MEMIPFTYQDSPVRTVENDGHILFCGKDVATALGYKDQTSALKLHCKGVAKHHPLQTPGGIQQFRFITEGDLYRLVASSKLPIGANRLFARLREDGFLIKRKGTDWNMPTQRAMELGLFKIKESSHIHSDGHVTISKTPKVTGKGQTYLVNHYLKEMSK